MKMCAYVPGFSLTPRTWQKSMQNRAGLFLSIQLLWSEVPAMKVCHRVSGPTRAFGDGMMSRAVLHEENKRAGVQMGRGGVWGCIFLWLENAWVTGAKGGSQGSSVGVDWGFNASGDWLSLRLRYCSGRERMTWIPNSCCLSNSV